VLFLYFVVDGWMDGWMGGVMNDVFIFIFRGVGAFFLCFVGWRKGNLRGSLK